MDDRQALVLTRLLEQDTDVQIMIAHEPALRHVMTIAAKQTRGRDRWFAYTALKNICDGLVGWGAYNPALRKSAYWEKMMIILDELLPDSDQGIVDDLYTDYEVEIERAFYRAQPKLLLRRRIGKA